MLKEFRLEKFRESNSKVDRFEEEEKNYFFMWKHKKWRRVVGPNNCQIAFISDEITI